MKFAGIRKHVLEQPFVFATGTAALIHSTWSLGTLFSGNEPAMGLAWLGWLIPALLIAFSLDVGQIVTAAEIRSGQRSWKKFSAFATFAAATYYLQWIYIAAHMPQVQLAPGISPAFQNAAATMRDLGLWIIPLLLPASTLLYTFSEQEARHVEQESNALSAEDQAAQVIETAMQIVEPEMHEATCPRCGKLFAGYKSAKHARNAILGHSRHCTGIPVIEIVPNGHHKEETLS